MHVWVAYNNYWIGMVLAELGRKITSALQKFNKTTVINE